jgi:hypothetical protein
MTSTSLRSQLSCRTSSCWQAPFSFLGISGRRGSCAERRNSSLRRGFARRSLLRKRARWRLVQCWRTSGTARAMEVRWSLSDSDFSGDIPFVQPHQPQELRVPGMKPIYEAGARAESGGRSNVVRIECSYRSLSGRHYHSSSAYDCDRPQFVTRFADDGAASGGSSKS